MVIASYLLDKALEKGYKQGYAQGYPQGLAQGRAKAYKDVDKQLAPYFNRMRAALDAGEDFTEPPPKLRPRPR